jgi:hypothetical protein
MFKKFLIFGMSYMLLVITFSVLFMVFVAE